MAKGSANKHLISLLKSTKKSALSIYRAPAVKNSFLRYIILPVIHICNFVLLRKLGNLFVEMEISSICNSKCIFCPYVAITKTDKQLQTMTPETFDKVLDKLKQVNYKIISFTPTTGDTLTNKHWSDFIYKATQLPNIETVLFYTNGILMNERNVENLIELLKKDRKGKIFSLMFSLGGYDEETYKYMFGVDKFNQVTKNIKHLLKRLQEEKMNLLISLEFRVPGDYKPDLDTIKKDLNPHKYPFLEVRVPEGMHYIEGSIRSERINYNEVKTNKDKVCAYMRKTRFAADGGVWADGCVVSELPNNKTMQLGSVNNSWKEIEGKRKLLVDAWVKEKKVPSPCQDCSMYRCEDISFKNDPVIPIWKDIFDY